MCINELVRARDCKRLLWCTTQTQDDYLRLHYWCPMYSWGERHLGKPQLEWNGGLVISRLFPLDATEHIISFGVKPLPEPMLNYCWLGPWEEFPMKQLMFSFSLVFVLCLFQDLTNYKYDKLVTKALAVLNRYFSSKMDMFKCAVQAQVSSRVHLKNYYHG